MSESNSRQHGWAPVLKLGLKFSPLLFTAVSLGCNFAPKYVRPETDTPSAFKEGFLSPDRIGTWKIADPQDSAPRGSWWEIFQDAQLNELEDQVEIYNQNVLASYAALRQAQEAVREVRAGYFPFVGASASVTRSRTSGSAAFGTSINRTLYSTGANVSYTPDIWGIVRDQVGAKTLAAQATAADVETTRLLIHGEVAIDYFQIQGIDARSKLLAESVSEYEHALELAQARYKGGVSSDEDVAQAETQLESARVQATDLKLQRAKFEHALALLVGKPASSLSLPYSPEIAAAPVVPSAVPAILLERRPDIAAAERRVAEANAQIGVARAAFFPTVTLGVSGGLHSSEISKWFEWPSNFYSLGPAIAQTVFDAGARKARKAEAIARYDQTVAVYRQSVLASFQQVEDNLADLRYLSEEEQLQARVINAARRTLTLSLARYKQGIVAYLDVIVAQNILLNSEIAALVMRERELTASVSLIQALGGAIEPK